MVGNPRKYKKASLDLFDMARDRPHDPEIQKSILSLFLPEIGVRIASIFGVEWMYPAIKVSINHHHHMFELI